MIGTLDTTNELTTVKIEKNTWVLKVPLEICRLEGFAEGTLVSLTFRNGAIQSTYIRPSDETDAFLDRVVEEEKDFFEEMKRLGD